MRVLTVKQPWATLIVLEFKRVENRTWRTEHRGPLLIHSSRQVDPGNYANEALRRCLPDTRMRNLPLGQIIGVADLHGVIEKGELFNTPDDDWWFTGPIGWLLRNAKQFERGVPASGHLGLWDCPPDLLASIKPQL